jgi:hypothetical protein
MFSCNYSVIVQYSTYIIKCWARFGVSWDWIIGRKALLVGTGIMSCNGGLVNIIFLECLDLQDEQALTAHINF